MLTVDSDHLLFICGVFVFLELVSSSHTLLEAKKSANPKKMSNAHIYISIFVNEIRKISCLTFEYQKYQQFMIIYKKV